MPPKKDTEQLDTANGETPPGLDEAAIIALVDTKVAAAIKALRPKPEPRKVSPGRIVHFRIGGSDEEPELRPASIVRVWHEDCVNLQVEFDGTNDLRFGCETGGPGPDVDEATRGRGWRTSILEGVGVGLWRWPAKA